MSGTDILTKCVDCGGVNFYVVNEIFHSAHLYVDGMLKLDKGEGQITKITCANCDKEYGQDEFEEIEWR